MATFYYLHTYYFRSSNEDLKLPKVLYPTFEEAIAACRVVAEEVRQDYLDDVDSWTLQEAGDISNKWFRVDICPEPDRPCASVSVHAAEVATAAPIGPIPAPIAPYSPEALALLMAHWQDCAQAWKCELLLEEGCLYLQSKISKERYELQPEDLEGEGRVFFLIVQALRDSYRSGECAGNLAARQMIAGMLGVKPKHLPA